MEKPKKDRSSYLSGRRLFNRPSEMFGRPIKRFYSLICINLNRPKAEAQGNSEAAARYRQAVSLQRQIYRERAEQEEQAEKARAENPQADVSAAFEAAPPQISIPLSDLQRLIAARDKQVAAAESVIAGLEAAFRRTV